MKTLTGSHDHDPQDCVDCVLYSEPCPWHAGWQAGFDQAAALVGALVLDQQNQSCR